MLVDVKPDMKVVREEIFGPVVVAQPFDDLDEIAATANDTPFGLAAGIWTRDISKAHRLAALLKAGTVWINTYNVYNAALPFGGYKEAVMRLSNIEQLMRDMPVSDIRRTLSYHPELFGHPFSVYLQVVLRGPSDWNVGERELFAAFVSRKNQCSY